MISPRTRGCDVCRRVPRAPWRQRSQGDGGGPAAGVTADGDGGHAGVAGAEGGDRGSRHTAPAVDGYESSSRHALTPPPACTWPCIAQMKVAHSSSALRNVLKDKENTQNRLCDASSSSLPPRPPAPSPAAALTACGGAMARRAHTTGGARWRRCSTALRRTCGTSCTRTASSRSTCGDQL
jgi:hypothetical protein